jgi:hypothetical protein
MGLELAHTRLNLPRIQYQPNTFNTLGLAVAYNGGGIGASFKLANSGRNPYTYGRSQYADLSLSGVNRRWAYEAGLRALRGLYLANPGQFGGLPDSLADLPALPRPDVAILNLGVSYTRVFNPRKYSLPAALRQSDIQLRSAHSLLLRADAGLEATGADSSLVPPSLRDTLPALNAFRMASSLYIALQPGYGFNLVLLRRLCLSGGLFAGPALQRQRFWGSSGQVVRATGLGLMAHIRLGLAYQRPMWFMALALNWRGHNLFFRQHSLQVAHFSGGFVAGLRFAQVRLFPHSRWLRRVPLVRGWLYPRYL